MDREILSDRSEPSVGGRVIVDAEMSGRGARARRGTAQVGFHPDTAPSRALLPTEACRRAESFERRGEPVIFVERDGRIVHMNAVAATARGRLFGVVAGRIATVLAADQQRFDDIVEDAGSNDKAGLVTLTVFSGPGQALALAIPVAGSSHDDCPRVSVLVVFLESGLRLLPVDEGALALLRDAVGLTAREVDVVRLIASGVTPGKAAGNLSISPGTTRLHLKAVFAKLGVRSQAELSMLVGRLA